MSETQRATPTDERGEDPVEVLREHREAFADVAASDLPIAEDCQRALDWLERQEGETDV
jgi:hypothetical protein